MGTESGARRNFQDRRGDSRGRRDRRSSSKDLYTIEIELGLAIATSRQDLSLAIVTDFEEDLTPEDKERVVIDH